MRIWQKYLFRHLILTFAFLLLCLFAVYCLIDLSIHGVRFFSRGPNTRVTDLLLYYFRHFAVHLDLFMPLAFLLSTLKVLFQLGRNLELVALQMAGLSRKKLLLPFFIFAALLSLLGLINHEYFAGEANAAAAQFKTAHSKSKKRRARGERVQVLVLEDGSELIYQTFHPEKKELFDVYWIRSERDLWHIKTLSFIKEKPVGYFADHFIRPLETRSFRAGLFTSEFGRGSKPLPNHSPPFRAGFIRDSQLQKQESFEEKLFLDLPLPKELSPKRFIPYENRSLSTLFSEVSAESRTHLHRKLALPLLPLLVLFSAAPFALAFSRRSPTFLIVSLSLFGFVAVMTLFDSFLILGENKVVPPALAMWPLPLFILAISIRNFLKI